LIHLPAKAIFPTDDFVGFWASSNLVLSGGNPYSAEALFLLQKAEGWKQNTPLIIMAPSWISPFSCHLALRAYFKNQFCSILLNMTIVIDRKIMGSLELIVLSKS
jgi:hypothetical protein